MDIIIIGIKLIYFLGLIFFLILSSYVLLAFWRFSLYKIYPLIVTILYLIIIFGLISQGLILFNKF